MRRFVALFALLASLFAAPLQAQQRVVTTVVVEEWVVEGADRFVAARPAAQPRAIASYGPFRVLDASRAALVDVTDAASPAHFAAMLRAHPAVRTLEMVDCPGTADDSANMKLGRMLRAAGLATHVPRGGSVRSGAVELFLAGAERRIDEGAEFAVHAWLDDEGRQPADFAADAAENRTYLDYYREMGMAPERASAFYAMTNSVPHEEARWLDAREMRQWLGEGLGNTPNGELAQARPVLAYASLSL